MGTLRDEVYENLDYLSQLTEVVIGPQNEVLERVPDRIEVNFDQLKALKERFWGTNIGFELSASRVLSSVLSQEDRSFINDIKSHFEFEVSDDFEFDLANQRMTGTVALVKTVQQLEEKKLLEIAIQKSLQQLSQHKWPAKRLREKIATILNTFEANRGTEWAKKLEGRAGWAGQNEIKAVLSSTILENKWRIRNAAIVLKIGEWINSYLSDSGESSTGLVNLLKLKIMVDKDLPIYSVDEVF